MRIGSTSSMAKVSAQIQAQTARQHGSRLQSLVAIRHGFQHAKNCYLPPTFPCAAATHRQTIKLSPDAWSTALPQRNLPMS
jgi:hypothetical protein